MPQRSTGATDPRVRLHRPLPGPATARGLLCALLAVALPGLPAPALEPTPGSAAPAACGAGPEAPDRDRDGVPDACDNCPIANPGQRDYDGDGRGDVCDACPWSFDPEARDGDGDGVPDACDACPTHPSAPDGDSDGDGIADASDNCLYEANPRQRDADGDGVGNRCDTDVDGDGFTHDADLEQTRSCVGREPAGACAAADFDGDGRVDEDDLAWAELHRFAEPGPTCRPPTSPRLRGAPLDSLDPGQAGDVVVQSTWVRRGPDFAPSHGTCHDLPFEHVQALAMLPDRGDGLHRWLITVSEDRGGWLAIAESPAGRVASHGHRSAARAEAPEARVVWSARLDGGWHGLVYNHPGDVSIVGHTAVVAVQNLRGGEEILGGIDTCTLNRSDEHPAYTDDALLFLDLQEPRRVRFLGRMLARELFAAEAAAVPGPLEHKWVDTVAMFPAPSEHGLETVLFVAGRTITRAGQMSGPRHERVLRSRRASPSRSDWRPLSRHAVDGGPLEIGSGHFRRGDRYHTVDVAEGEYALSRVWIEGDELLHRRAGTHAFHASHESIEACGYDLRTGAWWLSLHRETKAVGPSFSVDRLGRPRISCIGPWTSRAGAELASFQINLNVRLSPREQQAICESYRAVPHVDGLWREPVPFRFEGEADASGQECVVAVAELGLPDTDACRAVGSAPDPGDPGRTRLLVDPACPGVGYVESPGDGIAAVLDRGVADPDLLVPPRPRGNGRFAIRVRRQQ